MKVFDAPSTWIMITFKNGKTATTRSYGQDEDVWATAMMLEGAASHLCGWRPTERAAAKPERESYSPIRIEPCPSGPFPTVTPGRYPLPDLQLQAVPSPTR